MSAKARMKSTAGGTQPYLLNVDDSVASGVMTIGSESNIVYLRGASNATITGLLARGSTRNRLVWFVSELSGIATVTFTNTDGASTEGMMDLGGSNRALSPTDAIALWLRADGTWLRVFPTVDN